MDHPEFHIYDRAEGAHFHYHKFDNHCRRSMLHSLTHCNVLSGGNHTATAKHFMSGAQMCRLPISQAREECDTYS